ncbi:MAG: hypothetical protein U0Q15_02275 [Kineosporiaceae bacterium]
MSDDDASSAHRPQPPVVSRRITLAAVAGADEDIWSVLMNLAATLHPTEWCLIGGQMIALRAWVAGVPAPRTSDDLDLLSNLYVHPDAVPRCARAVRDLGFEVEELHTSGHRFTRGRLVVDVLAPDHPPKRASLRTVGQRTTIEVPGGTQALRRLELVPVERSGRQALVPVPNLLGALLLKADATRLHDPERHLLDVAFLTSLVDDPMTLRMELTASDRRRLRAADRHLADVDHRAWRALGSDRSRPAHAAWRLLVDAT